MAVLEQIATSATTRAAAGAAAGAGPGLGADLSEHSEDLRWGRELLRATRPFAHESVAKSWWYVISTFTLMIGALTVAGLSSHWPIRMAFSLLGALFLVRAFITYHDFMHGAILRESRAASILFHVYGCFALTPPRSWKESHNYHHRHVGQIAAAPIGSFPIITTRMWRAASPAERARYRAMRHPLIVLFGYLTVFAFSICLLPLLRDPKRHWDSALAILAHGGLIAVLWLRGGFETAFFVVLLPMTVAAALGSYLFFAQHSFKRMIDELTRGQTITKAFAGS
ncbi:MAG: fatty acid desaturase family protein [Steroidobacteraceae bacterium]